DRNAGFDDDNRFFVGLFRDRQETFRHFDRAYFISHPTPAALPFTRVFLDERQNQRTVRKGRFRDLFRFRLAWLPLFFHPFLQLCLVVRPPALDLAGFEQSAVVVGTSRDVCGGRQTGNIDRLGFAVGMPQLPVPQLAVPVGSPTRDAAVFQHGAG